MTNAACPHIESVADYSKCRPARMPGMRQDGGTLGASANLSVVRRDALLRFVAQPPRERSCANAATIRSSHRRSQANAGCTASPTMHSRNTDDSYRDPGIRDP